MKKLPYIPYSGAEKYAFFGWNGDCPEAAQTAEKLMRRGVRLFWDDGTGGADRVSRAIADGAACVFFLTEAGCRSKAFRNEINFALSLKKAVICVKLGDFSLADGLSMQLANVQCVPFSGGTESAEALLTSGVLTQDTMGGGMQAAKENRQKPIMAAMTVLALCLFLAAAFFAVQLRTSPRYALRDADGSEYLNISRYGEEAFSCLEGFTIGTLDISDGEFDCTHGLEKIHVDTVRLNQNQLALASEIFPMGIAVEVAK